MTDYILFAMLVLQTAMFISFTLAVKRGSNNEEVLLESLHTQSKALKILTEAAKRGKL